MLNINTLIDDFTKAYKCVNFIAERPEEEYRMTIAFFLLYTLKRLEFNDKDEVNKKVQKILYIMGLDSNEVPLYLEKEKEQ